MIDNALLWVKRPDLLLRRVGGLTLLERQLWTLSRAGARRAWINAARPVAEVLERLRLPEGLEIRWSDHLAGECPTPYLRISGDHLIRVETLAYIARADYRTHAVFQDQAGESVIQLVLYRADESVAYEKAPLPAGACVLLRANEREIQDWLLSIGPKSQDGFMARHFDRHISLALSRRLLATRVTPNMITILSCAVGLAGAFLFAFSRHGFDAAGAALVWLHSVLDGCDGELARIRFQESAWGAAIDFWGDNLVHVALFFCIGVGCARAQGRALPIVLGLCAVAAVAAAAALAFRQKLARRALAPARQPRPLSSRVAGFLAQRDFIYLLVAMAYWDAIYYFLWAAAVGAPLFLIVMMNAEKTGQDAELTATS